MMPIGKRLLEIRNDARGAGQKPIRARISERDMKALEQWVDAQNRPNNDSGLPAPKLSAKHLWGMDIVVDPKIPPQGQVVLEMAPGSLKVGR
jgi:hypothetical protein